MISFARTAFDLLAVKDDSKGKAGSSSSQVVARRNRSGGIGTHDPAGIAVAGTLLDP
jgi:hypothetical protein